MPEPAIPYPTRQSAWDKAEIRLRGNGLVSRARLDSAAGLHSADWLMAMPIASCGLALDNEAVRVAVGFRLGLDLCGPMFAIAGRRWARRATMDLCAENPKPITTPFCHQRHHMAGSREGRGSKHQGAPGPVQVGRQKARRSDACTMVAWEIPGVGCYSGPQLRRLIH